MAEFKFTNKAVQDLSQIWDYTKNIWSEKQAEKYYRMIIQACSEMAKKPQRGREYVEIYPDLKASKISKHIIFYRVMKDKSIVITRILHERMDLKSKMKDW